MYGLALSRSSARAGYPRKYDCLLLNAPPSLLILHVGLILCGTALCPEGILLQNYATFRSKSAKSGPDLGSDLSYKNSRSHGATEQLC